MKTRRERQFELIQQLLLNDITSTNAPKFASQRTLFGIKSSTETLLDRVVTEENQRIQEQLKDEKNSSDDTDPCAGVNKETSDEV